MRCFKFSTACLILLAAAPVRADLESGPTVGEKVQPLKVYAVTGQVKQKSVDYSTHRKAKPTIYIFLQAKRFSRPMARFLRKLDETVQKTDGAYIVAVWLTDDKTKTKNYLPRADRSLKPEATAYTLYPNATVSPDGWGINSDADVTAVVANHGKVTAVFAYRSLNETDVPKVVKAFKKSLKGPGK